PGAGRIVPTGAPAWAVGAGGAGRGGGALYTGRGPVCGTIMRGAGGCGAAATGGADGRGVLGAAGAAGGAEAVIDGAVGAGGGSTAGGGAAGRTGGAGAAAASFFCVIAFSTSPGREICDRSIFVLISSSPRSVRAARADGDCASDEPRMWARTFSASWSSSELEWVFFSVTPTSGS